MTNWTAFPFSLLPTLTRQRMVVPLYHLVSDEPPAHIRHLYRVRSIKEFREDLDFLGKHYQPLEPEELLYHLRENTPVPGRRFLLTFDDGLREFHSTVAPILMEKGLSAICFLNSGFVDNRELFFRYKVSLILDKMDGGGGDRDQLLSLTYHDTDKLADWALKAEIDFDAYLKEYQPYMTSDQIKELISKGFVFGAHSIDHPEFQFISHDEQIRQTRKSLEDVGRQFELKDNLFAFPFTDFGVKKAFFEQVLNPDKPMADLTFGTAGLKKDTSPRHIQRIPFEGTDRSAEEILRREYVYYLLKSFLGKNRIHRS